jgi:nucleotide-binding universal stress UspA family protein
MSDTFKILATTDFSDHALAGLDQAAALARRLGGEIALLYVVEDRLPPVIPFVSEPERRKMLESHREHALDKLPEYAGRHLSGCQVTTAAVIGAAAPEIVRFAAENGTDVIVMASHGYGPIRQLLLGSTTERVLHQAACPVLVVPSKK